MEKRRNSARSIEERQAWVTLWGPDLLSVHWWGRMVTGQISGLKPNQNTSGWIPEATMDAYTPVALVRVSLGHSVQNLTEAIFWKYGLNVCMAGSPSSRSAMAIYKDQNPGIRASAGGPLDMAWWPQCCQGLTYYPIQCSPNTWHMTPTLSCVVRSRSTANILRMHAHAIQVSMYST